MLMIDRYTEKIIRQTAGGKLVCIRDRWLGLTHYRVYDRSGKIISTFTI